MSQKLWGGRFTKRTDPLVERFTSSFGVDRRLARHDVIGSIAHAKMLGRCSILSRAQSQRLVTGLTRLLRTIERGAWRPNPRAEDVHTAVQQSLEQLIGPVAHTLHTARSRNDQVSLDLRLYCREAATQLMERLHEAQRALLRLAKKYQKIVIPGYTHLQRAQPVLFAHHLLAYVEMFERDVQRLRDARVRINVLPLGAGALAGTSLPIDRRYVAKLLNFPHVAENSMDAVSDRDFAIELLAALATMGVHLSRLAEDIILWASAEFGVVELDDAVATGSSLMPQKKNPDVFELIRGQAGFLIGQLTGCLTMMKGLPLTYNRDLQWDKRFVFDAVEESERALVVLAHVLRHVKVRVSRIPALLDDDSMCATDLAEYLVERGVAFTDAHHVVGQVVAEAERHGKQLRELPLATLRRYSARFDRRALAVMDPKQSVARKRSMGSTGPRHVAQALMTWQRRLTSR